MAEKPRKQDAAGGPDEEVELSLAPDMARKMAPDPAPAQERSDAKQPDQTVSVPGQLARDDRGNINWQWSENPDLQADDVVGATARIRALAPNALKLVDDDDAALKGAPVPMRRSQKAGYNPYESGEPTKQAWKKKRDLRELSKWLELKKKMSKRSDED